MAPRKLRTPPYCAWYCFVSLVLAIVGAGLYKRDFAGGKQPDAQTHRNETRTAGRRLRAAFTTTTAPVDPDSIQVDDDETDRVCFPAMRHGGLRPERVGQIVGSKLKTSFKDIKKSYANFKTFCPAPRPTTKNV